MDIVYLTVIILFFAFSAGMVAAFKRLMEE